MAQNILVIEDDTVMRAALSHFLRKEGWTVWEADSFPAACEIFDHRLDEIDVVITDYDLSNGSSQPYMNGGDILWYLDVVDNKRNIKRILLSGVDRMNEPNMKDVFVDHFLLKYETDKLIKILEDM